MTRAYAIRRLLEHGPLTFAELLEIVGCTGKTLTDILARMAARREVERFFVPGCHRFVYRNTTDV
jgi:DNA-binding MarR family transcriptional regulator